jgi:hypothetical protein
MVCYHPSVGHYAMGINMPFRKAGGNVNVIRRRNSSDSVPGAFP